MATRRRRRRHHVRNPRRYHARRAHRRNPRRHRRHHYRRLRNPRSGGGRVSIRGVVRDTLVPAGVGAAGGVALNVVMGYLNPYLPASLQTTSGGFNALNTAVQAAGALGVGYLAERFMGSGKGRMVAVGAMTVVLYGALRNLTAGTGIPGLSGLGLTDYTPFPTSRTVGAYLGRPVPRTGGHTILRGLGYVTPGTVVGPSLAPRMGAYMPRAVNVMPEETGI